jgi:hypothetical protein
MSITASSRSSSSSANATCRRYAPAERLLQSSLRQGPRNSHAKPARRGPVLARDQVIRGGEEVAVEQRLRQWLAVVSRAHPVADLLEPLAPGRVDLRVDRIEECDGCQQVLTRAADGRRPSP